MTLSLFIVVEARWKLFREILSLRLVRFPDPDNLADIYTAYIIFFYCAVRRAGITLRQGEAVALTL